MLDSHFMDNKSEPFGNPICTVNGTPITRCKNMIYWFRWGEHTFDIRVMWKLLGIKEQDPYTNTSDPNYMNWRENPSFYTDFINGIEGKDFNELMAQHDEDC